jgi:hypothetical protein
MSVNYYEAAMNTMGERETKGFYRFCPAQECFIAVAVRDAATSNWLAAAVS